MHIFCIIFFPTHLLFLYSFPTFFHSQIYFLYVFPSFIFSPHTSFLYPFSLCQPSYDLMNKCYACYLLNSFPTHMCILPTISIPINGFSSIPYTHVYFPYFFVFIFKCSLQFPYAHQFFPTFSPQFWKDTALPKTFLLTSQSVHPVLINSLRFRYIGSTHTYFLHTCVVSLHFPYSLFTRICTSATRFITFIT